MFERSKHATNSLTAAATLALLALAFVIYKPVLFNFFACDDYTHLTWLQSAIHQPSMIWKNFYSSWLDFQTLKFYRPIITCTLAFDYLLWQKNGLGYHITNVLLHAGTAIFLFLFCRALCVSLLKDKSAVCGSWWAFGTAALFVVHPLHPEVVSWITGRVDSVMSLFLTGSLWCYIRWHQSGSRNWLTGSLVCCVLSLGSKEMAVTIPPTMFALEFLALNEQQSFVQRLIGSAKRTAYFWAVLAAYFVLRRFALGTFVGGYGDTLSLANGLHEQLAQWWQSLVVILVPANSDMVPEHFKMLALWKNVSIICAIGMLAALCVDRTTRKIALFLGAWALFAILPVYKIFSIGTLLQGSRLAYLATIPLCALLALPILINTKVESPKLQRAGLFATLLLVGLLCYSGAAILIRNNKAWIMSGTTVNKLCSSGCQIFDHQNPSTQVYFLNVPDSVHGAYAAQGITAGLKNFGTGKLKVFSFGDNFGFHKTILAKSTAAPQTYWWNSETQRFIQLRRGGPPGPPAPSTPIPEHVDCTQYAAEISLHTTRSAWETDFIEVPLRVVSGNPSSIGLRVSTSLDGTKDFWQTLNEQSQDHSLWFNLHQYAPASFAGQDLKLTLLLPARAKYDIGQPRFHSASSLIPEPSISPTGKDDPSELIVGAAGATISCQNATGLKAANIELEVTRGAQYFSDLNARSKRENPLFVKLQPVSNASFKLLPSDFPGPGIHQGRLRAVDAKGETVGFTGDPFYIVVQ